MIGYQIREGPRAGAGLIEVQARQAVVQSSCVAMAQVGDEVHRPGGITEKCLVDPLRVEA
jgi:hypothetical protein